MTYMLLDLYCGAGGASVGYARAGFTVVGIDVKYQPGYPYRFIRKNVRDVSADWIADNFDAVTASPPCQAHSDLAFRTGRDYEDLIPYTRTLLQQTELPYVIENVDGAPLFDPVILCGTQFRELRVLRHRLFESNIPLRDKGNHGRHPLVYTKDKRKLHYGKLDEWQDYVQVTGGGNCSRDAASDAMGIYWMNKNELNEAIPPAYTEFIGRQMKEYMESVKINADS